eukprot:1111301-Rhodomonas_salina.1
MLWSAQLQENTSPPTSHAAAHSLRKLASSPTEEHKARSQEARTQQENEQEEGVNTSSPAVTCRIPPCFVVVGCPPITCPTTFAPVTQMLPSHGHTDTRTHGPSKQRTKRSVRAR